MTELNEQQLARLAKLGKRNPSASAATPAANVAPAANVQQAATPPVATHSAAAHSPSQVPWSPPAGPAATASSAAATATAAKVVIDPNSTSAIPIIDRHTNVSTIGSRRRHVAAAGRILATGLATSGFLATIASLATADARAAESKQADAAPPTTLLETIHRVVYVDEFGNPIAPPTTLSATPPPTTPPEA